MKTLLVFWQRRGTAARVAIIFLALCVVNWTRIALTGHGVRLQSTQPVTESRQAATKQRPVLNMQTYRALQDGMSYQQAVAVLGEEGKEISSNRIGEIKTVMYQWQAGPMANMNAMFQNNKLVSKAQFGLE